MDATASTTVETVRDEGRLCAETAAALAAGEVVGWYQGRAEWGPRALGNRSILGDPAPGRHEDILNLKIKRRESFRPFAPSILRGARVGLVHDSAPRSVHDQGVPDPAGEAPADPGRHARGRLRAAADGLATARTRGTGGSSARSSSDTGVPIVLNTSFNENEPIVNTPAEALDCFLRTKMDRLVLGNVVVRRVA